MKLRERICVCLRRQKHFTYSNFIADLWNLFIVSVDFIEIYLNTATPDALYYFVNYFYNSMVLIVFPEQSDWKTNINFVDVPEWLSGMTRNHVGFARAGSNPAVHVTWILQNFCFDIIQPYC